MKKRVIGNQNLKYYVNCSIIKNDTIDNFHESEANMVDEKRIERLKGMVDRLEVVLRQEVKKRYFSKDEKELLDEHLIVEHLLGLEFFLRGLDDVRKIQESFKSGIPKQFGKLVEYAGIVQNIILKLDCDTREIVCQEVCIPPEVKRALSCAISTPDLSEEAKRIEEGFENLPIKNFDYFDGPSVSVRNAKIVKNLITFEEMITGGNGPIFDITPKGFKKLRLAYGIETDIVSEEQRNTIEEDLLNSVGIEFYRRHYYRKGIHLLCKHYYTGTYYIYIP